MEEFWISGSVRVFVGSSCMILADLLVGLSFKYLYVLSCNVQEYEEIIVRLGFCFLCLKTDLFLALRI